MIGGGYEYHFVATPADWLMCNICHYPSRDPYLSGCCGHTFCKSCLDGARKATTISDACPICRDEEFVTIPHKQANRTVRSLHVFCTNKEKGCEWQGEVNNIVSHVTNSDGCQFEEVICPNGCRMCVQRQYLSSHVEDECVCRLVDCQYCHITGEHQFIEGEHKDQCPKFPIDCPNKCEVDNIPREDINEHKKMCPLEKVTCPNDCGTTLQRQYIHTHIKMECPCLKVECRYCHITGEQQFIKGNHKEQCPKFPIACPNKCEVGSVPRDDVEEHKKMCPLELVQCEYHMVGCEERMARKDQKKHNKEKMEEHLSITIHQLTKAQHNLASSQVEAVNSREKLTAKTTQIGKDLATTKRQLTSAQIDTVKTIDRLIQRIQQTERDLATKQELTTRQLEKYKVDLTVKVEQVEKESNEQLAVTENNLTLKLQQTENDLTTTKQELAATKENLRTTKDELKVFEEESKRTTDKLEGNMRKDFDDESNKIADMNTNLMNTQEESRKWKDDLIQQLAVTKQEAKKTVDDLTQRLIASQQEAKKTKTELVQKCTNTERELNTTKQQLATTCQNLTKAEKEHTTLAANTDEALAKLENKFQTKITEIETTAQKRITELETKLEEKTQQIDRLLVITWRVDIVSQATTLSSGDQVVPVIVKMSEYTKKKSADVYWFSDSFYTHHKGYRMTLKIMAAGNCDGSGTHLSIGLLLMKGPYDDQLRWPLKGHCEVKLLNQVSNSEHRLENGKYQDYGHKRVTTSWERSLNWYVWVSYQFISNEGLHKITPTCQYLKDDNIFIKVDYKLLYI